MRLPLLTASNTTRTDQAPQTLNVAHRGASSQIPENTLAAVRRAIASEADFVELDVQRAKDGALVLVHDTTLTRTTNVQQVFPHRAPWRVSDFTSGELARVESGTWKSPAFSGEPIATLDQAIDVIRHTRSGLLLELKAPDHYPGIVSDVVSTLRDVPGYLDSAVAAGRLVVQSFNVAAMKDHKTQAPSVPVGLLGAPARGNLPALGTWADQVNPSHLTVDKSYVDAVHGAGMRCLVWTVNRRRTMRRALRMGVDGVITDRPDVLARVLAGCTPAPP